jgi:hypothetical protein
MNDASQRSAVGRGRRTILLVAAACLAPVIASYAVYYLYPRSAQVNYGTLLEVAPAPTIEGVQEDGTPFRLVDLRGRWVLLAAGTAGCDAACERALYAMRQAHTMQGKERDRIVRVWIDAGGAPPIPQLRQQHPGLIVALAPAGMMSSLPGAPPGIWLIDPLGNLVLSYPADPDIKGLAKDLTRLLQASRIGDLGPAMVKFQQFFASGHTTTS